MSIADIEAAKALREQGARLGRIGLSQRVNDLVIGFVKANPEGHYKEAIHLAGQLHAIFVAAKFDGYWREKAEEGFRSEKFKLEHFQARPEDVTVDPELIG